MPSPLLPLMEPLLPLTEPLLPLPPPPPELAAAPVAARAAAACKALSWHDPRRCCRCAGGIMARRWTCSLSIAPADPRRFGEPSSDARRGLIASITPESDPRLTFFFSGATVALRPAGGLSSGIDGRLAAASLTRRSAADMWKDFRTPPETVLSFFLPTSRPAKSPRCGHTVRYTGLGHPVRGGQAAILLSNKRHLGRYIAVQAEAYITALCACGWPCKCSRRISYQSIMCRPILPPGEAGGKVLFMHRARIAAARRRGAPHHSRLGTRGGRTGLIGLFLPLPLTAAPRSWSMTGTTALWRGIMRR